MIPVNKNKNNQTAAFSVESEVLVKINRIENAVKMKKHIINVVLALSLQKFIENKYKPRVPKMKISDSKFEKKISDIIAKTITVNIDDLQFFK